MLGIVLINYFSEDEVITYVKNELSKIKYEFKIVIVNNSDSEESRDKLKYGINRIGKFILGENIFITTDGTNSGFAKANNLGASFLSEMFNLSYILFSNSDIKFKSDDVVGNLLLRIETLNPDVAVIGPRVIGLDSEDQSPHYEIKFLRYFLRNTLPFLKGKFKFLQKPAKSEMLSKDKIEGYCYWVSGCFLMIKADDFFKANMFDTYTFLYGEEKILAERLLRINKRNYFYPEVEIIHEHGKITANHFQNKKINSMVASSNYYYYTKYKNINSFFIKILKTLIK